MTGINEWLQMEHKDHAVGARCRICDAEAAEDFKLSPLYPDYDYDYSEDSMP